MYNLSTDYQILWLLIFEGNRIACFVDYKGYKDEILRDIALCYIGFDGKSIHVSARGTMYGTYPTTYEDFVKDCESINLEFIEPNI